MKSVQSFLLSSLLIGIVPVFAAPFDNTTLSNFNATFTNNTELLAGDYSHKKNGTWDNSYEAFVTVVVATTTTVCPAGQTITDAGKTTVLTAPVTSTIYQTITKTVCPKCTGKPGMLPGGQGGYKSGAPSREGSSGSTMGSSGNSGSPSASTDSKNAVSNSDYWTGVLGDVNKCPWSGSYPSIDQLLSGKGGYPNGFNVQGDKQAGKNAMPGAAIPDSGINTNPSTDSGAAVPDTAAKYVRPTTSSTKSSSTSSKTSTTLSTKTSSTSTSSTKSSSVSSISSTSTSKSSTTTTTTSSSSSSSSSSSVSTCSVASTSVTCPTASGVAAAATAVPSCYFWMENIKHQGISAFNANPGSYQVFRNVKDFGAKGDGVTDDTAAINSAISSGGRCAPGKCGSSTTTPAVVYFPPGTYVVSTPIINYYYTQIIGNPNCMPVLQATANFNGAWVLDNDQYQAGGVLGFGSTNVFWRQVRNLVIDITAVPASTVLRCVHDPTAQATSLQNMVFKMSSASGTQHEGVFIESGSGGFMTDLVFYGGLNGMTLGNQQFTMRNLTFNNAVVALNQLWDWGWTYQAVTVNNCQVALNMSGLSSTGQQSVGSVVFIDSTITNTPIGILTSRNATSQPFSGNSLILENVKINNVPTVVQHQVSKQVLLAGSTGQQTIAAWAQGTAYIQSSTQTIVQQSINANPRPASLVAGGNNYYTRSKPQYESYLASQFLSARTAGAKGDGVTDDTAALQAAVNSASAQGLILFIDAGTYKVTKTVLFPANLKVVGESYSVIMSSGCYFADINNPKPVVQVGAAGCSSGSFEMSDIIVSTQGVQAGAILIEWNIAASGQGAAGLWDVHERVGGFAGSNLQLAQCPTANTTVYNAGNIRQNCIAAFMGLHITKGSSGGYFENNWLWVADHDVEDPNLTQITIYAGRGLLDESTAGGNLYWGTAVEHWSLYQYSFQNTKDTFMGQIQTETAYWQPNPAQVIPTPPNAAYNDPTFPNGLKSGWGLRIIGCTGSINVYGAGLYDFFNNYSTVCSDQGNGETCQSEIVDIESSTGAVNIYNLNTVGTTNMLTVDGADRAPYSANLNGFIDTVAIARV